MVKVKICGITNLEDALASLFGGADAIGFVFYKRSPRYITPEKAASISRILPKRILKVGVFVNAREKDIKRIARLCSLDILQLHGEESPEFCSKLKRYKVIKAFKVNEDFSFNQLKGYKTFAYLFDAFSNRRKGGTGRKFDWNLLKNVDKIKHRFFLSGGLSCYNVKCALKAIQPDWVDISTGVELSPGRKDHKKIVNFIRKVK